MCLCFEWVSRIDELDLNALYDLNLILYEIKPGEEKRILFCWPKVLMASRQYGRVSKLGARALGCACFASSPSPFPYL